MRLLGARIRRARKADPKLTIEKLAALVGCSRIHLMRLEKGIHEPSDVLLERISEATGQPLSFFTARPVRHRKTGQPVDIPDEAREAVIEAATTFLGALMEAVAATKRYADRQEDEQWRS